MVVSDVADASNVEDGDDWFENNSCGERVRGDDGLPRKCNKQSHIV